MRVSCLENTKKEEVNYSVTGSETTKVMGLKREEEGLLWWSTVKRLCMSNAGGPGSIPGIRSRIWQVKIPHMASKDPTCHN